MASHQLPLPAAAGMPTVTRRARVDRWAAPDPAALVLDPWAPPIGYPVASNAVSPWSPPLAMHRIGWLPAPAELLPAPALAARVVEAETSTERALATLRAITAGPAVGDRSAEMAPPGLLPAPDPATRIVEAVADDGSGIRWRLVAIATGVGAAVAAGATLVATLF